LNRRSALDKTDKTCTKIRRFTVCRFVLVLVCAGLLRASGNVYDVTADWANNSNPNGVWSYDQGLSPLPYQSNLGSGNCFSSASGISGGYAPGIARGNSPPCLPAFLKATGNAANLIGQTGDVIVHAQAPSNGAGALIDLIHKWPSADQAREVLMITSGIDPAYGPGPSNPYLDRAIEAAQREGVIVHSIYFSSAGHFGHSLWQTHPSVGRSVGIHA
jgi:hypothetical protein